ncbi:MAG: hypothetical protein DHS20C18_40570 [Saprospiraceae bacterium]|nr:MAG: hypothetical protein DHS20C18_40570 [Saprospiraceae bacterium]
MVNSTTTVHFKINGPLDRAEVYAVFRQMKKIAQTKGEVNLLVEIDFIGGWRYFRSFFFGKKIKGFALRHIRRYAIVTNKAWMENAGLGGDGGESKQGLP